MDIQTPYFIQLVKQADGTRSKPFASTMAELAYSLTEAPPTEECLVLILGIADPEPDTSIENLFSPFPLVGTEFFVNWVKEQKEHVA